MFKPTDSLFEAETSRVATATDASNVLAVFRQRSPTANIEQLREYLFSLLGANQLMPRPFDYAFLVGQFALETGYGASRLWREEGNPAGIGIWKDGVRSPWTGKLTGNQAACIHLAELAYHVYPLEMLKRLPSVLDGPRNIDAEHLAKVFALRQSSEWPRVAVVNDLSTPVPPNNYVWAADQEYGEKIALRANSLWPDLPDAKRDDSMDGSKLNMTKGLIPMPPMAASIVDVSLRDQSPACRGYDWLGYRPFPKFLVLHRAQSPNGGTIEGYFHSRCVPALTDLEVNNLTGVMKRYVKIPGNSPSGWANGVVSAPYGDGKAVVDRFGVTAVNRDGEACEVLGHFAQPGSNITWDDPLNDAAKETIAQWFASRGHDYGIPWSSFPVIAAEGGRSYVVWHEEFTFGTGKRCPGPVVKTATPVMIKRAQAIMKGYQTMGVTPPATPVSPTESMAPDGKPWVVGLDLGILNKLFGTLRESGRVYSFNPRGTVSMAWYVRGKATNKWPFLYEHFLDSESGREYFIFSDGAILWKPEGRVKFRWM